MTKILSVMMIICILAAVIGACPTAASAKAQKHTITFDVRGIGETPDPVTVNDGDRYLYMRENDHGQNPTADGYVFHCWVTTLQFYPDEVEMSNTAYYDETPIHEDMTLYAIWYKIIDEVEIEVDPPVAGDVIGTEWYEAEDYSFQYQSPRPLACVRSEGAKIQESNWFSDHNVFWLEDPNDRESTFKGTLERGKEYGVWMMIEPIFGYEFADTLSVTVNGELLDAKHHADYNVSTVIAPIKCVDQLPYVERFLGDVDSDGEITVTDAVYLQRKAVEIAIPFPLRLTVFDVDGDGEVTVMDSTALQYYLADLKVPYSIGETIG